MSSDSTLEAGENNGSPDANGDAEGRYIFPRWANLAPLIALVLIGGGLTTVVGGLWYYGTDKYLSVGYTPNQPVAYSHKLHAGDLGMDCRYCHYSAERSSFSVVPPTQVCMNCHAKVKTDSPKLLPVRESMGSGKPIPWVRVHNLPDYVYFNHSAHLGAGVGCSSCHGRVDKMIKVTWEKPLTMGWCLDCHRNPGPNIRKKSEITKMDWEPADSSAGGEPAVAMTESGRKVDPPKYCSGCHR